MSATLATIVQSDRLLTTVVRQREKTQMLRWAVIFLVIALVAALLGFGGIAGTASGIALVLFWVFIAVTVVLFLVSLVSRSSSRL